MKKFYYLISMAAVLSLGACQNEDDFASQKQMFSEVEVEATLENGANSRTSLSEGKVYWEENDALSVFLGNTTGQKATIIKESMNNTYAQFKITVGSDVVLGGGTEDDENSFANVAYYPYGENVTITQNGSNYVVSAILSAEQSFKDGSFGTNVFPMVAVNDGLNFGFRNVAGMIHIPLKGTATITKVTVESKSHKLAGNYNVTASANSAPTMEMASDASSMITLSCGDEGVTLNETTALGFDFVLPVGDYEASDLTFKFYDNNNGYMEFVATNADKVERSKRTVFSEKTYTVTGYNLAEGMVAWIGSNTYTSISSAVEASQANDVIKVKPGTYTEVVNVKGAKNVTIEPANVGDNVTIAGIDHQTNGSPSTIVVNNLTIDNSLVAEGWFTGTAQKMKPCVGAWGGNLSFNDCKFIVSGASGAETGVMTWWVVNKVSLTFNDCTFEGKDNHASARAMQIYGNVDLVVTDCTFNTYKAYSLKYVAVEGNVATFNGNKVNNSKYLVQLGSATYPGSKYTVNINNTTLGDEVSHFYIDNNENQMVYIDGICYVSTSEQLAYVVAQGVTNIMLAAGTYELPSLSGKNVVLEGASKEGTVINVSSSYYLENSVVTLKNLTYSVPTGLNYTEQAFAFIHHAKEFNLTNCIVDGRLRLNVYKSTIDGCQFNITTSSGFDGYGLYYYGKENSEVAINNSTFNTAGKAIVMYNEGAVAGYNLTVDGCTFISSNAETDKAAIQMHTEYGISGKLTINESTATGFADINGGLWNELKNNGTGTLTDNFVKTIDGVVQVQTAAGLNSAVAAGATVVALAKGTYNATDIDVDGKTVTLKGIGKDVVLNVNQTNAVALGTFDGSNVTFENLTISTLGGNYKGFARMEGTYNDCTFEKLYFTFQGKHVFNRCVFNANNDEHCIWTYGADDVAFNNCEFNYADRCVNVYTEMGVTEGLLAFTGCKFNTSNELSKGAVEINSSSFATSIKVDFDECTKPAYGEMVFISGWDSANGSKATVTIDDSVATVPQLEK